MTLFPEEDLLPISALQHWLYCPRQCALIHLEQAWAENKFTAEGRVMHERAHDGLDESRSGLRITRGLPAASCTLGITGQCDVVEFHADGTIRPVEYKRGKPKDHRADEVQLCAQAMCLEEMRQITIMAGDLYYGEKRRRTEVLFDNDLRTLVQETINAFRHCIHSGITPLADYDPRRCDACSLIEQCQPHALRFKRGVSLWFQAQVSSSILTDSSENHP
jgi:CRISPR-associated exonuclease Cas4